MLIKSVFFGVFCFWGVTERKGGFFLCLGVEILVKMGTNLQHVLRSICVNSDWKYAIFWKLKHHARMYVQFSYFLFQLLVCYIFLFLGDYARIPSFEC